MCRIQNENSQNKNIITCLNLDNSSRSERHFINITGCLGSLVFFPHSINTLFD